MKYAFSHQLIKRMSVSSKDITIEFTWQEFSSIVILLTLILVFTLWRSLNTY